MSAFAAAIGVKADIGNSACHVCLWPVADFQSEVTDVCFRG